MQTTLSRERIQELSKKVLRLFVTQNLLIRRTEVIELPLDLGW